MVVAVWWCRSECRVSVEILVFVEGIVKKTMYCNVPRSWECDKISVIFIIMTQNTNRQLCKPG